MTLSPSDYFHDLPSPDANRGSDAGTLNSPNRFPEQGIVGSPFRDESQTDGMLGDLHLALEEVGFLNPLKLPDPENLASSAVRVQQAVLAFLVSQFTALLRQLRLI